VALGGFARLLWPGRSLRRIRHHKADAARTARFFGTIQNCNLVVEAGAVIVGTVRIGRPGSGPDTATSGSP
jgi:hypothetical protein